MKRLFSFILCFVMLFLLTSCGIFEQMQHSEEEELIKDEPFDNICNLIGHEWNNGEVTKVPTVHEHGIITYTCRVCSEIKEEIFNTEFINRLTYLVDAQATNEVVIIDGIKYYYGQNLVNDLTDAISNSLDGAVILVKEGEYELTEYINHNVTIKGAGAAATIIKLAKDVQTLSGAEKVAFEGVTLYGNGGGADDPGAYFNLSPDSATEISFKDCIVKAMNTFIKVNNGSQKITIEGCEFYNMGQFTVWTLKGTPEITVKDSYLDAIECGLVNNATASMFRIRSGSATFTGCTFKGTLPATSGGLFEAGTAICTGITVDKCIFVNATKVVKLNSVPAALTFVENYFVDAEGNYLTDVPEYITGAGVTPGVALVKFNEAN